MNASGKQALGDGWESSGASSKQEWQHSLPLGESLQPQLFSKSTSQAKEKESFWDTAVRVLMSVSFVVAVLSWGPVIVASVVMASNTKPPLIVHGYTAAPVHPGELITVYADVERDLERRCSARYSRKIIDSVGSVYSVEPSTDLSYHAIKVLDELNPNKLTINVLTPTSIQPGWATIITPVSYSCNPVQKLFPINIVLKMRVQVIPWD